MRRLLPVLSITAAAVFLALALAPACGDQCNRSDDCASGEVCYAGVCEPLTAAHVRCGSNNDCDPNGRFVCRAGRCELKNNTPIIVDTGVEDPDGGDAAMGPPDNGMGPPDNGMMGFPDAATSTIADGGDAGPPPMDASLPGTDIINGTLDTLPITWDGTSTALIQATFNPTANATFIQGDGNTGTAIEGRRIEVNFPGGTPGTFTCATPGVVIEWQDATGTVFVAGNGQGNCTLTVTSYGAVTEAILGSFTGTLQAVVLGTPPPATETPTIMGNFDVIRDPDLP